MTIKEWVLEMGRALKMLFGVMKGIFEVIVELAWWLFAVYMWITAFVVPLAAGKLVLSMLGLISEPVSGISSFSFQTVLAVSIIFSMPYFYIYNVRKQKVSTSYKFFIMCTFVFGAVLLENETYKYYVEHCRAGIVKVQIIDAETKEPLKTHSHKPLSAESSSKDTFKTRYSYSVIPPNHDLEYLVWGIEPITFEIGSDGYESKNILLDPQKGYDDIALEMQKIKPAK